MTTGTVIVTGGGRGIGAATSPKLAAIGYAVAVNYAANEAAAQATVEAIRKQGGRADAFGGDVGDPAAICPLFDAAVQALGPLAGLVNNAGILGEPARIEAGPRRPGLRVNLLGDARAKAVRRLSARRWAQSSISRPSPPGSACARAYAVTKGAIETFTKGLANEVAREGIRVNCVAPGMTATDMSSDEMRNNALLSLPMGRVGEAEEIAEAVVWLMSPAASYATGTVLTVSGGR